MHSVWNYILYSILGLNLSGDGEIVGYIEFTSDFQIEFKHDKTYEELEELAKKLEDEYYFIINVSLNLSFPMQTND